MSGGLSGPLPEERPHPEGRRTEQGVRIDPEAEATHQPRKATLSALVSHEPGVLARVAGLFSRRQFNIESLTVGPTTDPDRARITLVIEEPDPGIEQAKKQLRKLVPVVSVRELRDDAVERELALVKVGADAPDEVAAVADMFDGEAVDTTADSITVEVTGSERKIDAAIETLSRFDVHEIVRTGTAALERGPQETATHD